jgi:gliding motility-associated-like protein
MLSSIFILNTFTPNGDGVNDFWDIPALVIYSNVSVFIYDRWGSLVYQSNGYTKPWDGTFNGKMLPAGTYYYVIKLATLATPLSGWVAIIR